MTESKMLFVVEVSHQGYALDPRDLAAFVEILNRARRVEQKRYSGPYYLSGDEREHGLALVQRRVVFGPVPADAPEPAEAEAG